MVMTRCAERIHWRVTDKREKNPDNNWGDCRRRPPVLIGELLIRVLDEDSAGTDIGDMQTRAATLWPCTSGCMCCGEFESAEPIA
jgi:hypothetical protein